MDTARQAREWLACADACWAAARHLPYSTLGFLQYLTPTLLLILAVQLFGEPFPVDRQLAFFCIWAGLAVYSLDTWRIMRKSAG